MTTETKKCRVCGEEKPIEKFSKTGARTKTGAPARRNTCYFCNDTKYKKRSHCPVGRPMKSTFPKSAFDLEIERLSKIPLNREIYRTGQGWGHYL